MPPTPLPVSMGPTADADLYFSYSLVEMAGFSRCSGLWEMNFLILTVEGKIFEAEARILNYDLDP